MRTHFLNKLTIPGRESILSEFPNFDFYNLRHCREIILRWKGEDAGPDIALTAEYVDPGSGKITLIELTFQGVRQAELPEISSHVYLSELEIEDTSGSQLEGVRYKAKDFGGTRFEVLAGEICIALGR